MTDREFDPISLEELFHPAFDKGFRAGLEEAAKIVENTAKDVWAKGTAGYVELTKSIRTKAKEVMKGEKK